jgi:hypothetical protein
VLFHDHSAAAYLGMSSAKRFNRTARAHNLQPDEQYQSYGKRPGAHDLYRESTLIGFAADHLSGKCDCLTPAAPRVLAEVGA